MSYTIVSSNKPASVAYIKSMQQYLSKCLNKLPNVNSISQYAKKPSGMVLKTQQLIISIQLITEMFESALKSAHRPKPTAVFHIKRSRNKYSLATSVLGGLIWSTSRDTCQVEQINQNETSKLVSPFNKSERKLDNKLYERFGQQTLASSPTSKSCNSIYLNAYSR